MPRISTWEQALADYLAKTHDLPHAWGQHDCMLDWAGAAKAMTGHDFARGHRGKYISKLTAYRYLKTLGFDSPEAMIDSLLPEKPVGFAQRGDVVLDRDGVPGICNGGEALFILPADDGGGRILQPRSEWVKAWLV